MLDKLVCLETIIMAINLGYRFLGTLAEGWVTVYLSSTILKLVYVQILLSDPYREGGRGYVHIRVLQDGDIP